VSFFLFEICYTILELLYNNFYLITICMISFFLRLVSYQLKIYNYNLMYYLYDAGKYRSRDISFWNQSEDLHCPLVAKSLSRNKYQEIKSCLHFNDNSTLNPNIHGKDFKIEPLYKMLNKEFKKFGFFDENMSVDEQIVKYYGRSSLKQYIRGKPIRFGFKNWILSGEHGYCYHADLYCGKSDAPDELKHLGVSSQVVGKMAMLLPDPLNQYQLFFDNYFTSLKLMYFLTEKRLPAIGTARECRLQRCPLLTDKELRKAGRGAMDCAFDLKNEIGVCKWNDNKPVTVVTNHAPLDFSQSEVQRRQKGSSAISVRIPEVVKAYNAGMGFVDQLDWNVAKYRVGIRSKKWYWCLFTNLLDVTVVNACILFNMANPTNEVSHHSV